MGACPYLGIRDDSTIMLSESSHMHRCFAEKARRAPALDYQTKYCLRSEHAECPVYKLAGLKSAQMRAAASVPTHRAAKRRVPLILGVLLLLGGLATAAMVASGQIALSEIALPWQEAPGTLVAQATPAPSAVAAGTPLPESAGNGVNTSGDQGVVAIADQAAISVTLQTAQAVATVESTNTPETESLAVVEDTPTPSATATPTVVLTPTLPPPTVTPSPIAEAVAAAATTAEDGSPTSAPTEVLRNLVLTPSPDQMGWLDSTGVTAWSDTFLYAGAVDGANLISGMRFDLSRVGRGAAVEGGTLHLTGLADNRLDSSLGGLWRVQFIGQTELSDLTSSDFMMLYSAPASITTLRDLSPADLTSGVENTWELDSYVLDWLTRQVLEGATSMIVRIVYTPEGAGDTLFAWDSGLGDRSGGNPPVLNLTVGAVPATPPPLPTRDYLVATFTPAPLNVLTLVAQQQTATAVATSVGTYTPVPPFVTPTPPAENLATLQSRAYLQGLPAVAVETPTPKSAADATEVAEYATAVALTTGTYTPVPTGYVTPFVVPPSPPAENLQTEVARITEATAAAETVQGTQTPAPHNMIIGEWVTATPTPANVATASAISLEATRMADLHGRATETPFHWIVYTATPTPLPTSTPTTPPIIMASDFTPTPIPTATEFIPDTLPDVYKGLVFFKRGANPQTQQTWSVNPATGEIGMVTREWIYTLARKSIALSPNGQEEVFVRTNNEGIPELFIRSVGGTRERKLTNFSAPSYDPAWSPDGQWIAFVSSNSGNDEIYRVTPDGSVLQQLTHNNWEWDKHPTWSPDSTQIVFFSNRDVGRTQIWVMNADGSSQRRLVQSEEEDMYPVWAR